MKIDARFTYDKIRHDQDFDAHLVLSVTAPTLDLADKRQAVCIVPVIDVSPSMQGPKFDYAKRSILKLIDHLAPGDYCGLIQFSSRAHIVSEPLKITPESKDELKRKVGELRIGSATNIADALLVGLAVANKMDLSADVTTRVILFTDGDSNTGVAIKPNEILALLDGNLGLASVSAFGYGTDVKQDFLAELARKGKANYAFVRNPDDALSAFGKELGGLLSTYATDLVLEVQPLAGHHITSVISDVDAEEDNIGGEVTIRIPDILAEETRHIILGVKLAAQKSALPRPVNVLSAKLSFDVLDANSRKERKNEETKAKLQFMKPGEEQDKPDQDLDRLVSLAQVIRAQIEAEEFAKKGNYRDAQLRMDSAMAEVRTKGHVHLQGLASKVRQRVGSAVSYNASGAYLASVSRGGVRGMGVASYDAEAASDLASVGVQMANSVQASTSNSFAGGVPVDHVVPPVGDAIVWNAIPATTSTVLPSTMVLAPTPPAVESPKDSKKKIRQAKSSTRW